MTKRWFVYAAAAIALALSGCAGDVGQDDDAEELDDPSSEEADFAGSDSVSDEAAPQLQIKDFDDARDRIRLVPGPGDGDPGPMQHPRPARHEKDPFYRGEVPVAVNPSPV